MNYVIGWSGLVDFLDDPMEAKKIFEEITAAFQEIIKELDLHPTRLDIELTMAETVHVYLTATEFSGKSSTKRDLIIWPDLEKRFVREVIASISLWLLLAPEEDPDFAELSAAPTVKSIPVSSKS